MEMKSNKKILTKIRLKKRRKKKTKKKVYFEDVIVERIIN